MVEITILAHHEAVLENGAGSIHIILGQLLRRVLLTAMNIAFVAAYFHSLCNPSLLKLGKR
jgi:hypothetical protein